MGYVIKNCGVLWIHKECSDYWAVCLFSVCWFEPRQSRMSWAAETKGLSGTCKQWFWRKLNYPDLGRFLLEIAKFISLVRRLCLAENQGSSSRSSWDPGVSQRRSCQNFSKQCSCLLASVSQMAEHHLLTFSFKEISLSLTPRKKKQILSTIQVVKRWFLAAKWCNTLMSSSANLTCHKLCRMCEKEK